MDVGEKGREPKGEAWCKDPLLLSRRCQLPTLLSSRSATDPARPSNQASKRGCVNLYVWYKEKSSQKNNFLGWLSSAESVWDIASAWRLSDYMGPSWVSQSTCPPPRTALCQDQRLEPVLRQSALVHDLTLHDRTALRWKLEQEKRL